jgi:hypothetical protein
MQQTHNASLQACRWIEYWLKQTHHFLRLSHTGANGMNQRMFGLLLKKSLNSTENLSIQLL